MFLILLISCSWLISILIQSKNCYYIQHVRTDGYLIWKAIGGKMVCHLDESCEGQDVCSSRCRMGRAATRGPWQDWIGWWCPMEDEHPRSHGFPMGTRNKWKRFPKCPSIRNLLNRFCWSISAPVALDHKIWWSKMILHSTVKELNTKTPSKMKLDRCSKINSWLDDGWLLLESIGLSKNNSWHDFWVVSLGDGQPCNTCQFIKKWNLRRCWSGLNTESMFPIKVIHVVACTTCLFHVKRMRNNNTMNCVQVVVTYTHDYVHDYGMI